MIIIVISLRSTIKDMLKPQYLDIVISKECLRYIRLIKTKKIDTNVMLPMRHRKDRLEDFIITFRI